MKAGKKMMEKNMKKIEIYTKPGCPYCQRAKSLLRSRDLEFTEYDITVEPEKEQEMRERSGRKTVPEIFFDNSLIGGCDDLMDLEQSGQLDSMVQN